MRSGRVVPLSGLVYELSKYSKGPLAKATMYVDIYKNQMHRNIEKRDHGELRTMGVVSKRVIFHLSDSCLSAKGRIRSASGPFSLTTASCGSQTSSEIAGILLKFTASAREIIVMANVALSAGSSQQGNARLAAVA
jgi:hypothetical protein